MSLSDYVPPEFMHFFEQPGIIEALKGFARYLINEDLEFQEEIKTKFNAHLATSEIRPVQRLAEIETVLGIDDFSYDDEDHEPPIPEQITRLNNMVSKINTTLKPELIDRSLVAPSKNITEIRADFLIEYVKNNKELPKAVSPFANIDTRVLDSKDFKKFVENYLPEEYQPESMKNLRKLKRDVFEAAEKRCSTNDIFIDKADHGRKELRLIFARQIPDEELPAWMTGISDQTVTA
jgi:hypothetical protein